MLSDSPEHHTMREQVSFVLEPLPPLENLKALWRDLDRTGGHSFFLSWTWIGTLLRNLDHPPLLLKALDGRETAGLALLTLKNGRLRHLFPMRRAWLNATGHPHIDGVMIEHNGFAVASRDDAPLWQALIDWYAGNGFPADELIVPGRLFETPLKCSHGLSVLERRRQGYRTPLENLGREGIASIISRNARQQLRRSMRDYEEGVTLDRAPCLETALDYFARMKELHIASWTRRGKTHAFVNPFFEKFHRALIESGMQDGNVDLLRIRAGECAIGYLYNFRRNGVVYSYQSGFADECADLRPGYVCHALAIAHYAAAGMTGYDFLAGTNRLKQSFGLETYELGWLQVRKPTFGVRIDQMARQAEDVLRRLRRG